MPDATLTTQQPNQPPHTRPVPPSWASVAGLLERWQMALVPHRDGCWDVLAGFVSHYLPHHAARRVPFAPLVERDRGRGGAVRGARSANARRTP